MKRNVKNIDGKKTKEEVYVVRNGVKIHQVGAWGITTTYLRGIIEDKNGDLHFS